MAIRGPHRFLLIVLFLARGRGQGTPESTDLVSKVGCQSTKGCIFAPAGCDPAVPNNCISGVTYQPAGDHINFELFAKLSTPNSTSGQYAALGFSKDQNMGDDAVTHCTYSPATGKATVSLSYNPEKYNQPITDNSWVDSQIRNASGAYVSGILVCRFSQAIQPPSAAGANLKIFALDHPYYLLIATGPTKPDGGVSMHSTNQGSEFFPKVVSSSPVSLVSVESSSNASQKAGAGGAGGSWRLKLVKSHGTLMIFGWWLLVASAILFARYFKTMLSGRQLCGLDLWFHFHRGLNTIGVLAIATAFVCIFVVKDGKWTGAGLSYDQWYPRTTHAILGMTAAIGGFVQPIMAVFRCDKYNSKRPIFNWIHRFVGLASWGCASAAIWLSTEFMTGLKPSDYYTITPRALMIFYWAVLGLVIIGLEVWITISERLASRSAVATDIQLRTINGKTVETTVTPVNKRGFIRGLFLLFFVVVAISVTVALACFIALPDGL